MNILTVLEETRTRLAEPASWCQKAPYRDREGKWISPRGDLTKAVQACLVSAIKDAARPEVRIDPAINAVRTTLFGRPEMQEVWARSGIENPRDLSVALWNDYYATHADLIAVLDETIARLKEQEKP